MSLPFGRLALAPNAPLTQLFTGLIALAAVVGTIVLAALGRVVPTSLAAIDGGVLVAFFSQSAAAQSTEAASQIHNVTDSHAVTAVRDLQVAVENGLAQRIAEDTTARVAEKVRGVAAALAETKTP